MNSILFEGCSGVDVFTWQKLLNAQGDGKVVEPDGDFGPKTKAATIAYQKKHGLLADGMVGPITWAKAHPNYTATKLKVASNHSAGPIAEKAIEFMREREGLQEIGKNRGPEIDKWNIDANAYLGAPWCVAVVQAGFKWGSAECGKPDIMKPDTASVFYFWENVPDSWKIKNTDGQRGDIGIMAISHMNIVAKNCGNGYYETWEGNTGKRGEREGKYIRHKTMDNREARKWSEFLGFIRIPEGA